MRVLLSTVAPLLVLGLFGLDGAATGHSFEPTIWERVARVEPPQPVPTDTLRASADPERPLILTLPDTLSERPVERYTLLRGPALSGVAGRSFTWIPEGAAPGTHEALLEAHHRTAPTDTLVLRIDLQP